MGALGSPLGAGRMDVPDGRHCNGLLLGLLRARLGRLVVLGSGRKCVLHAMAGWNGTAAFSDCHGKTLGPQNLDSAARDPDFLTVAFGNLPGALRRVDVSA